MNVIGGCSPRGLDDRRAGVVSARLPDPRAADRKDVSVIDAVQLAYALMDIGAGVRVDEPYYLVIDETDSGEDLDGVIHDGRPK